MEPVDRCEDIFRAVHPGYELRDSENGAPPTMEGHFAVFNEWTEIDSLWEGRFMEQIAPGAFKKTFKENRPNMRVLFQHGRDPTLGDKVLGPIDALREDDVGAYYEVPLLDAPYVRDNVLPGLEANLYGASFRFKVVKEEFDEEPKKSKTNPNALPERTVTEARVMEFGPVTFPAYASATAGLRSVTDEFKFPREVLELIGERAAALRSEEPGHESEDDAATTPEEVASRSTRRVHDYLKEKEVEPRWRL